MNATSKRSWRFHAFSASSSSFPAREHWGSIHHSVFIADWVSDSAASQFRNEIRHFSWNILGFHEINRYTSFYRIASGYSLKHVPDISFLIGKRNLYVQIYIAAVIEDGLMHILIFIFFVIWCYSNLCRETLATTQVSRKCYRNFYVGVPSVNVGILQSDIATKYEYMKSWTNR